MVPFSSVRDLRRWAISSVVALAFVLVDFEDSVWLFEVYPDGHVCSLRAVRSSGVYA